jgi:diacylglycerol kinase (ATP)
MADSDKLRPAPARRPDRKGPAAVTVVFNPSGGGEQAAQRREEVRAGLEGAGVAYTWLETTPQDAGGGLVAQAVGDGAELVVACGGDGTVRACAAALAGTDVPLAVLPLGTGNLIAVNFDLPVDVEEALKFALTGPRRRIDLITLTTGAAAAGGGPADGREAEDTRFVGMAGVGLDAAMVRDVNPKLKSKIGPFAYVLSTVRNLGRARCRVRIQLDDHAPFRRAAKGVLIGNLGRLQGGVVALPDAVPDDGLLDVAVIKARRLHEWAGMAARALVRRRQHPSMVEYHQARRVELHCDRSQPMEQDGELLPRGRHAVAEVLPSAVWLVVPDPHPSATEPPAPAG